MANGRFLNELLTTLTRRYATRVRPAGANAERQAAAVLDQCQELLASDSEVANLALARDALTAYEELAEADRLAFFEGLADRLAPDPSTIAEAYERYAQTPDSATAQALNHATRSPRLELLRRLNTPPGHTYALVRIRADLQRLARDTPGLEAVDADFMDLFRSWFNRGFLVMQRIDWNTPANMLEKIIAYEAVHTIQSWDDLRRRLAPADRRCFGFFHPATGDEPLIFVQVALTRGLPAQVQPILRGDEADAHALEHPETADTATFFSISNCQSGLRGISFGNFLIKQVVEELRQELPNLKHFVTLSPIPGFAQWLQDRREGEVHPLDEHEQRAADLLRNSDLAEALAEHEKDLRQPLMRLAARYLVKEKNSAGLPVNPVSRFHLGNGAEVRRINWMADTSDNGLRQSYGLMVNYLYRLEDIERNHEGYATAGKVACSREIQKLLRQSKVVTPV